MKRIAFIGAGNMGEALIRGILAQGLFSPRNIMAADPDENRRGTVARDLGIRVTGSNREAAGFADIVLLAVKPQILDLVIEDISPVLTEKHLLISILAGVTTRRLEERLGGQIPVVRVMPNTPSLVGAGIAAICAGRYAGPGALDTAEEILKAAGTVIRLPEELIDAVTAVSGSGPAYIFLFTEALARAGRKLGLSREQADTLARKTVSGAGKLLEESGRSPEELRRNVTSPGGTTEAALQTFRRLGFDTVVEEAVAAACRRAKELGNR
ncbi:MAG: pyrroline-5-carboxylate reductase [PVC group bacterium]